jgi:sugar/nucleoside kinase (ribokinase family)
MSLITVGTMAFDAIETPFGKANKIIGGSAMYAAYAASYFVKPVQQISIIGYDFPQEELNSMEQRGIKMDGVERKKNKKSFFWKGKYHQDMNSRDTLVTDLNVLADFNPVVPPSYNGSEFVLLGNLMPKLQLSVMDQLRKKPKLVAMDTMNFWMQTAMDDLKKVLKRVDLLLVNDAEARELTHQYSLVKAAKKIFEMGPKYLVIKKGEHGALLFHKNKVFFAPAFPLEDVFDPTGAGDTFAGGFTGYLAKTGNVSFANMKKAIIMGSVMASFCVEKFGATRLKELTKADINKRIKHFKELTNFETTL